VRVAQVLADKFEHGGLPPIGILGHLLNKIKGFLAFCSGFVPGSG
jgi:hypothetical protein